MAISELIDALLIASQGEDTSPEEVRRLRWDVSDHALDRKATESWRRLVNYADDQDIRLKDEDYARMLRDELRRRADELSELIQVGKH